MDLDLNNKLKRFQKLNKIISKIHLKRISTYVIIVFNYQKVELKNGTFIKYYNLKKNLELKYKPKRVLIKKVVKIYQEKKWNFFILTFYKTYNGNLLFFDIYSSFYRKKVSGKLQNYQLDRIIRILHSSDKIESTFFEYSEFNKKFYEKFLLQNINVILHDFNIINFNKIKEGFEIHKQVGLFKNNILNEILLLNNDFFYLEINFSYDNKINSPFPHINLFKKNADCFFVHLRSLDQSGVLDFKIPIKKVIRCCNYQNKFKYNLSDIYTLANLFYKNFEKIWLTFDRKMREKKLREFISNKNLKNLFFGICHQKINFISNSDFYPKLLLRKILTLKPKTILLIFLINENTIKTVNYKLKNKQFNDRFYNINDNFGLFSNIKNLIDLKLFKKAGERIFKIFKNKFIINSVL